LDLRKPLNCGYYEFYLDSHRQKLTVCEFIKIFKNLFYFKIP